MISSNDRTGILKFERGEVIAEEGAPGGGFYVLLEGIVGVRKQGVPVAQFSTRGMVFGEIGSILSRARTAQLVALEATTVTYFNADLDELIARHPKVAKTMLVSLAQRLERTTDAWWVATHLQQEAEERAAAATPPSSGTASLPEQTQSTSG